MEKKDAKKDVKVKVVHNEQGKAVAVVKEVPKNDVKKPACPAGRPVLKVVPKIEKDDSKKAPAKPEKKQKDAKPACPVGRPVTLTFKRDVFQKNIAVAADFTAKKDAVPVLTHILIDSDGQGHCKIVATDLEVAWTKLITCKGPKMTKCLPVGLLLKEVKALPAGETEAVLEFKENIVKLNGRCKIFTLSGDDFPKLPAVKTWKELHVDNFITGLKEVSSAMGSDDTRYALNGVYLDMDAQRVAATDGHRLHFENIRTRGDKAQSLIIPRRAVTLILKYPLSEVPKLAREKGKPVVGEHIDKPAVFDLDVFGHKVRMKYEPQIYKGSCYSVALEIKGPVSETGYRNEHLTAEEIKKGIAAHGALKDYLQAMAEERYLTYHKTVAITVSEKFMTYPAAGGEMLIKAIEGTYPQYADIIPKSSPIKVSFSTSAFLQNMEGALPLTTESVTLKINGSLTIQAKSPDRGDYKWQIPCKTEGKSKGTLDIRFNAKYLIDAIKSYTSQQVLLELKEPHSACLVNKKAVVMPMRIDKPDMKAA